jgi:FKBP-type peptidyl-prolyl cis-trans isomerase
MKLSIFLLVAASFLFFACSTPKEEVKEQVKQYKATPSGLKYHIAKKGDGRIAKAGQTISVHYIGQIEGGEQFDNSYTRQKPFVFQYKITDVIEGWDEALTMMSTGSKWEIIVPPALGYGETATDLIPANSTLLFTIEILDIK